MKKEEEFERVAMRVSTVSIIANAVLTAFKLLAGVLAHSGAMISDAVHSASDVFSTVVVIIGIRISRKDSDRNHPYGHERLECVAAIVLATILAATGLGIGYSAVKKMADGDIASLEAPGVLALVAAVVSIVVKEAMYQYTKVQARRIDSGALMGMHGTTVLTRFRPLARLSVSPGREWGSRFWIRLPVWRSASLSARRPTRFLWMRWIRW